MVVEADESDGTFLKLPADVAVVTNVDPEHLDHFQTFDAIKEAFFTFVENLPFYGFAVMCLDHPTVQELVGRIEDRRVLTYGENPQADIRLMDVDLTGGVTKFSVLIRERATGREMTSGRARSVAGFATRADKDPGLGADDLRPQWRRRAGAVGFGARRLDAVLDRAPRRAAASATSLSAGSLGAGSDLAGGALAMAVTESLGDLRRPVARRDVVRTWCRSLPGGGPGPAIEDAADRLLHDLVPESGPRGRRDGPGVAERRRQVPSPAAERRAEIERAEVARLLAGRGMDPERAGPRRPDIGFGLG